MIRFMMILVMLSGILCAQENCPLRISVETDGGKSIRTVDKGEKYGKSTEETLVKKFKAKIENTSMEPVTGVKVRILIAVESVVQGDNPTVINKTVEKEVVSIAAGEEVTVEVGEVEIVDWYSETRWRGGEVFRGYVTELFVGDQRVDVQVSGGSAIKMAYEVYQQKEPTGKKGQGKKKKKAE